MQTERFIDWIIESASDLEDGEMGMDKCIEEFCTQHNLSDEACEIAQKRAFKLAALEAGIPLEVVEGKRKLNSYEIPQDVLSSPLFKSRGNEDEKVS